MTSAPRRGSWDGRTGCAARWSTARPADAQLGFPTANLAPESTGFIPADGIYAGWLIDSSQVRWPAAISVGSNPTFEGVSRQVEAHVIDRPAGGNRRL